MPFRVKIRPVPQFPHLKSSPKVEVPGIDKKVAPVATKALTQKPKTEKPVNTKELVKVIQVNKDLNKLKTMLKALEKTNSVKYHSTLVALQHMTNEKTTKEIGDFLKKEIARSVKLDKAENHTKLEKVALAVILLLGITAIGFGAIFIGRSLLKLPKPNVEPDDADCSCKSGFDWIMCNLNGQATRSKDNHRFHP